MVLQDAHFGDLKKTIRFVAFFCLLIPRVTPRFIRNWRFSKIHVFPMVLQDAHFGVPEKPYVL